MLFFILLSALQSTLCIKFHIMTSLRSDCPGELAGEPCLTLQQYVSYPSHNSNITLEFESGNHSLNSMFTISSGTYFGLVATTNATINCDGLSSANIRISSITKVDIKGINFIRCRSVEFNSVTNGTIVMSNFYQMLTGTRLLYLSSSTYILIVNSNFSDNHGAFVNYGSAIYSSQVRSLTIIQTSFSNNTANYGGGAIYFETSRSTSTYLVIEGCSFFNNRAVFGDGGAVYVSSSYQSTIITSNGNVYENNSAYSSGGVFYISSASMATVTENRFINNRAINNRGGALYVSGSNSISNTGNTFMNNTARGSGGALYLSGASSVVNTGNDFVNNTATYDGGAVYVSSSSTTNSDNSFMNNRAIDDGGAIYVSGNSVNNGNTFINNMANDAGGAIYASGSITDTKNTFSSNKVNNNGGAVYVSGSFRSVIIDGSNFINNRARNGGGGALYVPNYSGVSVTTSNCTFVNNIGYVSGGALSVLGSQAGLSMNGNMFVNNLITGPNGNGGAVYVAQANAQIIIVNNSIFVNNSATNGSGGAMYTKRGFSIINSIFGYNRAPLCAAMSIEQSTYDRPMMITRSTFLHNIAVGSTVRGNIGGVGCIRNANMISILSSTFSHNIAAGGGGVFDIEDSTIIIESSTFKNNTARVDGGVFYTRAFPSRYTINESTFINNRAEDDGGVIYLGRSGSFIQLFENSFTSNVAGDRGGVVAIFGSTINMSWRECINSGL